ncbi:DUF1643 domain-containing protein [Pedobacter frigidisoli]|uniref:DUF1643 domain-containing protein n=1 Tax=Pedobacter frigidisoli TaxID=2530455 RepID=A0A4R0NBC9_9SPHI|nr:DUF1643 domain-containing protein [Pedobacter frigidisoli]TCC97485.1 DUF1643 domain-containing protein [Pedobacter frigidisoli]
MKYNINVYEINSDNTNRFVLGNAREKPLLVIGLNPSIANDSIPDPTIKKVMGFAEGNGFDSFIMLNLYPQRATNPSDLHLEINELLMEENLRHIETILLNIPNSMIMASWGEKIRERQYFKKCINSIYQLSTKHNSKWLKIGTLTNSGHPRHPLYSSFHLGVNDFDMPEYINNLQL